MTQFHLKILPFRKLQVLRELIFRCLIVSNFFAVSGKWADLSRQELSFNRILKECLIPKDLQIIRKKADIVLLSVHLGCTAENFKVML